MTDSRRLRVFLCHSSTDTTSWHFASPPSANPRRQRLNAEGWIDPWLDEEKLLPGQDWDMEIEKAVEAADAVIVCLSDNSVTKEGYIQKELRKVLDVADEKPEGTIFVIPVQIDDIQIPRRLRMWHYVDYFPAPRRVSSILRLIASLKKRAEGFSFPIEAYASDDDVIAIEVRILNGEGKTTSDFWFVTKPNVKVDELLARFKVEFPDELSGELGDYRNESLLIIRPKVE